MGRHSPMPENDDITQFFTVIYEGTDGRMHPCIHKHLTSDSARECAKELDGLSIMEWVKDRKPQFKEFWVRPDMLPPS